MQCLTFHSTHLLGRLVRQCIDFCFERRAIFRIADERVTDMLHVYPNLMRPAGFQPAFYQ